MNEVENYVRVLYLERVIGYGAVALFMLMALVAATYGAARDKRERAEIERDRRRRGR